MSVGIDVPVAHHLVIGTSNSAPPAQYHTYKQAPAIMLPIQLTHALLAILPLTVALPAGADGIEEFKAYSFEPLQWKVPASPGGPLVKMNGTVQEVIAQLRELNPHFDESSESGHDTLQKRLDFTGAIYHCHQPWNSGYRDIVEDGITYLRKVGGVPNAGPGPASCARVSCSYNGAIVWCNDNPEPKTLFSFGSIADGAQFLVNNCKLRSPTDTDIGGRVFHNTGWNVAVERADC
ncbi:hypothetical protein CB0940_03813 [Cercospora beticola]|uniref:Ecp2 effector protein domain-containing protein n=2 Tax=Cercospora beticola TaxID=122368 RepID=A0A2G5I3S8_CERBT|nr:hypothetical protein CB0940_03813 [Cercospora beticola]PIA99143.1 hypothetical protein CB0940_03813 [Cercospora beticola]